MEIAAVQAQIDRTFLVKDLMLIQQERICAYEQLLKWVENSAVARLLGDIIAQCRLCLAELRSCMDSHPAEPAAADDHHGAVYQSWPGIHQVIPGCPEKELLRTCMSNELSTIRVYRIVLSKRGIFCLQVRKIFSTQLQQVMDFHRSLHRFMEQPSPPAPAEPASPAPLLCVR